MQLRSHCQDAFSMSNTPRRIQTDWHIHFYSWTFRSTSFNLLTYNLFIRSLVIDHILNFHPWPCPLPHPSFFLALIIYADSWASASFWTFAAERRGWKSLEETSRRTQWRRMAGAELMCLSNPLATPFEMEVWITALSDSFKTFPPLLHAECLL